jgi:hypothetical protein
VERLANQSDFVREALLVFLQRRLFPAAAPDLQFQSQQLGQQVVPLGLGYFAEVLLDLRPAAREPGRL